MARKVLGKEWILTALCAGIQDRGFRIPRHGFRIPGTAYQILCQWNVDSGFQTVAQFRIPITYPGFQSPGLRIPQAKIIQIADFSSKFFRDFGIRITSHGSNLNSKLFAYSGVLKNTITPTPTLPLPPAPDAALLPA